MLTKFTVAIISKYIHKLDHYVVHFNMKVHVKEKKKKCSQSAEQIFEIKPAHFSTAPHREMQGFAIKKKKKTTA